MNVALTRAKSSLFILGNAATLERSNADWKEIVTNARTRTLLTDVSYILISNVTSVQGFAPTYRQTRHTSQNRPPRCQPGLLRQQRPANSELFPRLQNQWILPLLRVWLTPSVQNRCHRGSLLIQSAQSLTKPPPVLGWSIPCQRDRMSRNRLRRPTNTDRCLHHVNDPRRERVIVSLSPKNPSHRCRIAHEVMIFHLIHSRFRMEHLHRSPLHCSVAQDTMYILICPYESEALIGGSSH